MSFEKRPFDVVFVVLMFAARVPEPIMVMSLKQLCQHVPKLLLLKTVAPQRRMEFSLIVTPKTPAQKGWLDSKTESKLATENTTVLR